METIRVGILTVSDRCTMGQRYDASGELLKSQIMCGIFGSNYDIVDTKCVPDVIGLIQEVLKTWTDDMHLNLILTTGGTGLSPRDVTPEATRGVIDREATGISTALVTESMKKTHMAMLSRLVCGLRKNTLIINLPGSSKACDECLLILKPIMQHAMDTIKSNFNAETLHSTFAKLDIGIKTPIRSKVDSECVARRNRNSPYEMVSPEAAQSKIMGKVKPLAGCILKIGDALGYVVNSDIHATENFPPFPASMKDGYAVIAEDGIGPRLVISSCLAGDEGQSVVNSGECVRITTGAPIPTGADAVVQVEDTKLLRESTDGKTEIEIEILKVPQVGQDIRKVGSDIPFGSLLVESGTPLTSSELGLLATVGVTEVSVFRKPIIIILSTGDELQAHNEDLQPGKIRDSNKITLLALLKENGFSAMDAGIIPDNPDDILERVRNLLYVADVLVTTGGVSMGEKDLLTKVLVEDLKAELHFGRVNMKPGKPTKYFILPHNRKNVHVFALPGNPVSAAVTAHLFVLPALKALSGVKHPFPIYFKARLATNVKLDDRNEFARGTLVWTDKQDLPDVRLTGSQVSSRMLSMTSANCLVHLPADEQRSTLPAGHIVKVQFIK